MFKGIKWLLVDLTTSFNITQLVLKYQYFCWEH